jgi:putative transposase
MIKGALSRTFCLEFDAAAPLWARGFLARSVGRVRVQQVRAYLDHQADHHGYSKRRLPPVHRFRAESEKELTATHSAFDLSHHVVFGTRYRRGVFGSQSGEALINYWRVVADKRGFAIDAATVLPDHIHLMVRIVPKMSMESAALALMNNAQHWVGRRCPEILLHARVEQLWQPSAYAGTCGQVTTALVKSFLDRDARQAGVEGTTN